MCGTVPSRNVVLLEAPAGYGKSVLFNQWFDKCRQAGHPVAYVSARAHAGNEGAFLSTILAAIATVITCERRSSAAADSSEASRDVPFERSLRNLLRLSGRPWTLLIDDYEKVQNHDTDAAIQSLLENQPDHAVVGLATQRRLALPLSRWLLEGRLTRLGKEHMQFSRFEVKTFFAGHLTPTELQRLLAFTEGWPAAVKLAEICSEQWRGDPDALQALAPYDRLLKDFCASEILACLPAEDASLLVDCSLLDEIDPVICDAVRQAHDSSLRLPHLARRETFLEQLDVKAATFKMPNVLRHALRGIAVERRSPKVDTLFQRAAEAYAARGDTLQAVRYFVACGMSARAAQEFEAASSLEIAGLQGDTYAEAIFALLPEHTVQPLPRLALCRAYLDYKRGLLESARYRMEGLSARTKEFTVDREGGDPTRLRGEALGAAMVLNFYRMSSVSAQCLAEAERWTLEISRVSPGMAAFAHLVVGAYCSARGDLDDAEFHFIDCEKLIAGRAGPWVDVWLKYHRGSLALAHGQLMEAKRHLQSGIKMWRKGYSDYETFSAAANILLAEVDYENNALDDARLKVDEAREQTISKEGWHEHYAIEHELTMMILLHTGRAEEAELRLEEAAKIPRVRDVLGGFLELLRLRLHLLQGRELPSSLRPDISQLYRRWMDAGAHDEFSWRSWDLAGLCLFHFCLRSGELSNAMAVAEHMEQTARRLRRTRLLVKVLLLRAGGILQDSAQEAVIAAVHALEISMSQGYKRTILDEQWLVTPVLEQLAAASIHSSVPERVRAFAAKLLLDISPETVRAPDASRLLSKRELDVMHELNLGYSNKRIGRKLALTEPTVKFHLQNIFRKLGVRKREAAIAEAKRRHVLE